MGNLIGNILEWYMEFVRSTRWPKKIFAILFPVVLAVVLYSLFYLFSNYGVLKKLLVICYRNPVTPIVVGLIIIYGLYHKIKNPFRFIWKEFIIYLVMIPLVAVPISAMLYFYTTDLKDIEVWNGYVVYSSSYTASTT